MEASAACLWGILRDILADFLDIFFDILQAEGLAAAGFPYGEAADVGQYVACQDVAGVMYPHIQS